MMDSFREFMFESLDSSYKIIKTEKGKHGVDLFYLNVSDKEYRIFIERSDDDFIHIGFERSINNKWEVTPITNDLSQKEIFGLFGTIKVLIKGLKFKGIWIETDSAKKHQLYFNLLRKLNNDIKFNFMRDDSSILLYDNNYEPSYKDKFKYKKMF